MKANSKLIFSDYTIGGQTPQREAFAAAAVQDLMDSLLNPTSYSYSPLSTPTHSVPKTRGGQRVRYLVDADTHAYRAAAATDGSRWFIISSDGDDLSGPFKYKKEAINEAAVYKDVTYEQRWAPEPANHALKLLKNSLEIFDGRDVEYFVTGKSNFRYDIIPDYKGNRKGRRPQNLPDCKQYLMNTKAAALNENLEADDLVIIRAKELEKLGIPWTIVGCDKDLLQIKGRFYDPFKHTWTNVNEGDARYNLWKQIATGDSTDNIRSPKGLGPKTFNNYFKGTDWDEEEDFTILQKMVALYKTKVKQEDGEGDDEYILRVLMWIKTVASLVFLRRGELEEYQLPTKEGKINRYRS